MRPAGAIRPLPALAVDGYFTRVRTLSATALVLLACGFAGGCADSSSRPAGAGAPPSIPGGPDPVVLRVSRNGGTVLAYAYPSLDSVLWRSSSKAPSLRQILAFGAEDGYLAALDAGGAPVRVDLRQGSITSERKDTLTTVSSVDGSAVYAITRAGDLTRFTPSGGDWRFRPPLPASALFAQADGSLIVAGVRNKRVVVWRVRPPGQTVADSLSFDVGGEPAQLASTLAATSGTVGDRIFFGAHESVIVVRTRDMRKSLEVNLGDPVVSIAATPSGDRLFIALKEQKTISIIDRFEEGLSGKIRLPSPPTELRMDPLGRVLLARGAGDSVFVVSLGSDKLQGIVQSAWRGDLPLVLPDGSIAVAHGDNVVLANPGTLAEGRKIAGGAKDFWYSLRWNGFRPRAAGLDEPVRFRTSAPREPSDSDSAMIRDSAGPPPDAAPPPRAERNDLQLPVRTDTNTSPGFTVSFAAVLDERQARSLASKIRVDGQVPRITTSERAGKTLYRVVLGPYPTHDEAERVGRASAQSYWIFRGAP